MVSVALTRKINSVSLAFDGHRTLITSLSICGAAVGAEAAGCAKGSLMVSDFSGVLVAFGGVSVGVPESLVSNYAIRMEGEGLTPRT